MVVGQKIGNYELTEKINGMLQLHIELQTKESIFWRHKMYPTAFIKNWKYNVLWDEINKGNFWETIKSK